MFFLLLSLIVQVFSIFALVVGSLIVIAWIVGLILCGRQLVLKCRGKTTSCSVLLPVTGALTFACVLILCNFGLFIEMFSMVFGMFFCQ